MAPEGLCLHHYKSPFLLQPSVQSPGFISIVLLKHHGVNACQITCGGTEGVKVGVVVISVLTKHDDRAMTEQWPPLTRVH